MIVLDQVTKTFQTRDNTRFTAVEPTSLTIEQGEIFGLMGYSGAGKSTLLRLINLLERPDSGKVLVNEQDLTSLNEAQLRQARQQIGMIFQQFNLLSNRTVAENVAFPLEIAGWDKDKIAARVAECLEIVGLTERAGHYPAQLSADKNNVWALLVRLRPIRA
ncbi:DL-methionine transporter subunit; ATP-binding component of ABC superfamily (fragment) [Kingella kingae]